MSKEESYEEVQVEVEDDEDGVVEILLESGDSEVEALDEIQPQQQPEVKVEKKESTLSENNGFLSLDSFETISWLGKGAFGNVNLVRRKATNMLYALKVLNKEFIIQYDKVDSVFRERDILQDIQEHPNVVQFEATF